MTQFKTRCSYYNGDELIVDGKFDHEGQVGFHSEAGDGRGITVYLDKAKLKALQAHIDALLGDV